MDSLLQAPAATPSLKLKLTLNHSNSTAQLVPNPTPIPSLPIASTSSLHPTLTAPPIVQQKEKGKEKEKRKRTRRPAGEEGPGKNWRKGKLGNIVGVGAGVVIAAVPGSPVPPLPPSSLPVSRKSSAPPRSRATPTPSNGVAPLALDVGTPPVRAWSKSRKSFQSITGNRISLSCWQGNPHSAYAVYSSRSDSAVPPTQTPSKSSTPLPAARGA